MRKEKSNAPCSKCGGTLRSIRRSGNKINWRWLECRQCNVAGSLNS